MNKKGIIPLMFIGIAIVVVILIGVFAANALGVRGATSLTPKVSGCNEPLLNAEVSGDFIVKDGALFGIEPEVDRIDNIGIRAVSLAFLEPFNYEVELFDKRSNVKLDSVRGSNNLPSDVKELKIPFNLFYKIKDRDCDNKVDDSDLTIKITVDETKDIFKDTSVLQRDFSVRDGRIRQ